MRNDRLKIQILLIGILSIALLASLSVFGQERPPQQNQTAHEGRMMSGMQGPGPGMQGPGMRGPGGPGMMRGGPGMGPRESMPDLLRPEIQKELAITAEQRQKLEDIRFNSEKESIQHHSALQVARLELSRLTESANPDRAAIDKKIQEAAQEEAALMRSSVYARLNANAVLTAEQRAKLEQIMQTRMRAEGPRAEGGMPPGRPRDGMGQPRDKAPMPAAPGKPQEE
jgi:Spy/CpxP family protein refolding chaperone